MEQQIIFWNGYDEPEKALLVKKYELISHIKFPKSSKKYFGNNYMMNHLIFEDSKETLELIQKLQKKIV